jgi:hypothetical protein
MTNIYNVHIYREMKLRFDGIEAATLEAAAAIARDKATDEADDIDDCEGETLAALVDLVGDEEYAHSRVIDFEAEQQRNAAAKLLAALGACELQLREYVRWHHANAGGCSVEIESAWEEARAAIAEAGAAGIASEAIPARQPARFEIEHDPAENSDRMNVPVDGKFDVAIIRTDEGVVVDVYPKDGFETVATTYVFDSDVYVEQESLTN